jgi:hypothetical protein
MPTVIGSPTSVRTRARSRAARSTGGASMRCSPRTSRNASSMDTPCTAGVVSSKIANTARLAATYASNRGRTTTSPGHSDRACRPLIAVRTPRRFASYDAARTTPPPTATGRPRSRGSSRCSTEA